MSRTRILLPRYLLPVRPRGEVQTGRAVVVRDARIVGIEERDTAIAQYPDAERIELPSHVLMPGLINMHTHSAMSLLRGFADDLALDTWLKDHIWPAEKRWLSHEFVTDGTELAIAEMIRSGTTCFNEMYFFPDAIADVVERTGIRACVGFPVIEFETAWGRGFEDYLDKALPMIDALRGRERIMTALAPHAPYTVNDEMLARIRDHAERLDVPVHIHLLEIAWEIKHSLSTHDLRPLQRLRRLGLLDSRLIAVHMVHVTGGEIEQLAEAGVNVVHCPESNLKLASGMSPVADMLDAGVNVSIGTDGAASNNDLDLIGEMRTAALIAKGVSGDPCAVDAVTAIDMVTINAAKALGKSSELGSIEVGKLADLCAVDLNWPETQPVHHHVTSQLVYSASSRQVTDVWVHGRRLLHNGDLMTIGLEGVLTKAKAWGDRMAAH